MDRSAAELYREYAERLGSRAGLFAAVAALAATGIAHLLVVSTPDPLSYLGWIIGLSTAAAVVVPLIGGLPMAAAIAIAVINLVIGLAIGSLVVGAAAAPLAGIAGTGTAVPMGATMAALSLASLAALRLSSR